MKPDDKVKAYNKVKDKYLPGIVQRVEDHKGFRGYPYQKVWVEFEDETVIEFREYDVIPIRDPKDVVEVIEKPKRKKK